MNVTARIRDVRTYGLRAREWYRQFGGSSGLLGRSRVYNSAKTRVAVMRNAGKSNRRLEIGPGPNRVRGFETVNIVGGANVDYVLDARKRLPFADGTFSIIYASHVLEHVPWFQTETTLKEWVRVLAPGGTMIIWVPDGLKISKAVVDYESSGESDMDKDGWYRLNPSRDFFKWASGRIYTYGDESGRPDHPNWHRALFTPRLLYDQLTKAGLVNIKHCDENDVLGIDHGWINLGMKGIKS